MVIRNTLRWTWAGASVAALVFAMLVFDHGENRDTDIVLAWVMMTLSFPVSVVCAMFIGAIYSLLDSTFAIQVGAGRREMLATWLVFFGAGYLQWFYAVPAVWQKWRGWRDRPSGH